MGVFKTDPNRLSLSKPNQTEQNGFKSKRQGLNRFFTMTNNWFGLVIGCEILVGFN